MTKTLYLLQEKYSLKNAKKLKNRVEFFSCRHEKISDLTVTNYGDSLKVRATVASTVYAFTEKYPSAWVFATGSTAVRTRFYRMGISNDYVDIVFIISLHVKI